jgi:hypothetical protein
MIELAVLNFIDQAGKEDPKGYVASLKMRHKVPSNFAELEKLQGFASTLYLVSTINSVDRFLRDFRRDITNFRPRRDRGTKTMNALDGLLDLLPEASKKSCKGRPEYSLLTYYFNCRHYLVHATSSELASDYERLMQSCGKDIRELYRRSPNAPSSWTNGDRILCLKALITFADIINDHASLTPMEVALWMTTDEILLARLRASGPRTRLRKVAAKYAAYQFEADIRAADEIAAAIEGIIAKGWAAS